MPVLKPGSREQIILKDIFHLKCFFSDLGTEFNQRVGKLPTQVLTTAGVDVQTNKGSRDLAYWAYMARCRVR